jgi:hypothetical protein
MKRYRPYYTFIIFISLFVCSTHVAYAQAITFVQMTDAHLFDSGKRKTLPEARMAFIENRAALDWAILETNKLQATGKCIDFVVFTGDFGLELLKPAELDSAATDVARSFGASSVKTIFFVPGNNDLKDENPSDIGRYREFLQKLRLLLPDFDLQDLAETSVIVRGIRILGLDSASFKNSSEESKEANRPVQLQEMKRLAGEVKDKQPHIIFTHVPDLEDPFRGDSGEKIQRAWNLDPGVMKIWKDILAREEIIGVFAGHFHDSRRIVYSKDFGWASHPPDRVTAAKTWVAPPLAIKFQENAESQSRGFTIVTVTAAGRVTVTPRWLETSKESSSPDKSEKLREGDEEARDGDWKEAANAYKDALGSHDEAVQVSAKQGYSNARSHMRGTWWALSELIPPLGWVVRHWLAAVILIIVLLLILGWRFLSGPVIIDPVKFTADAPTDLFAAEMLVAADDLHRVLQTAAGAPFAPGDQGLAARLALPSPVFQQLLAATPDFQGVSVGKIGAFLLWVFRYFGWRIESGIGVAHNQAVGIATLRWAWRTRAVWRKTSPSESPFDIALIAKELVYNIMGLKFAQRP